MAAIRYTPPPPGPYRMKYLVAQEGRGAQQPYGFCNHLELGRDGPERELLPGLLLIDDPTVSWRHCILTQSVDGRCFVRDVSRNGTRLDGRRLMPNIETEIRVGQILSLGTERRFLVAGDPAVDVGLATAGEGWTVGMAGCTMVTVLVGDIRDYTGLVRRALAVELQKSVGRLFEILTAGVSEHAGTVKEYPGDAVVAFWEGDISGKQAVSACAAALALDRLVRRLAADPEVWALPDFSLQMDWGLATGVVSIATLGGSRPTGLSMIGHPIVLASRLEKFVNDNTGHILVCRATRDMACAAFAFRDLGEMWAKGFDRADHVFALDERDPQVSASVPDGLRQ